MKKTFDALELLTLVAVFSIGLVFTGCQQDDEQLDEAPDSEVVEIFSDNLVADDAAEIEISMSYAAQEVGLASGRILSAPVFEPCVKVTRDTVNKIITIDFGTGCKGPDGRIRKGKIIITFSGSLEDRIVRRVITFERYFVNNVQYTGEIEVSRGVRESNGHIVTTRTLKDFTLNFPDGNKFVTNGQMRRVQVAGMGDGDPTTNKVVLTGKKNGRSTKGRGYNLEIIEPVVLDFACKESGGFLRVSGIVEMTFGARNENGMRRVVRRVDYGDGTCDREITVTINGVTRVITKED